MPPSEIPAWVTSLISGAHGPLLADTAAGAAPPFLWPAVRGPSSLSRAIVGADGRAALQCGVALAGGIAGRGALMNGGAVMAVATDAARVLARHRAGGEVVLETVAVEYRRPVPLPGWIEAVTERAGGGGLEFSTVLRDREKDRDLAVVATTWVPAAYRGRYENAEHAESPIPAALAALVAEYGADPIASSDAALLSAVASGRPNITSQLHGPTDPRTHPVPELARPSRIIWSSPTESPIYRRAFAVSRPEGLDAWLDIRPGLEDPGGTAHPGAVFTLIDWMITGHAYSAARGPVATASLRLSFTPAGRAFPSGWMTIRAGRHEAAGGKRIVGRAEITDAAGNFLARAEGTFAVLGPPPKM